MSETLFPLLLLPINQMSAMHVYIRTPSQKAFALLPHLSHPPFSLPAPFVVYAKSIIDIPANTHWLHIYINPKKLRPERGARFRTGTCVQYTLCNQRQYM